MRTTLSRFFADLRRILGPVVLRRLVRRILENDILPLAGQLAYFFVLFLFPFLVFMVSLVGLVVSNPEPILLDLAARTRNLLPSEVIEPVTADFSVADPHRMTGTHSLLSERLLYRSYAHGMYRSISLQTAVRSQLSHALNSVSSPTFIGSILFTLGVGSAVAQAISNAANRSYGVQETRPFWKVRGVAVLLIFAFTLLVMILVFALLSPHTGAYLRRVLELPDAFLNLWTVVSWTLAFLAITVALDVLYYLAPNAEVPFRWITPGGFMVTIFLLLSSRAFEFFVANFSYDQFYGQLGTGIVLLVWLYVTGLGVLVGLEVNVVLTRLAEERLGAEIVKQPKEDRGEGS